jgi:hypothetical protein
MSQPVLRLELPEDIYERVRRAAKGMKQPVEKALVNIVKAAMPSLDKVPAAYRAELEAMEDLDDAALWKIAEGVLPPEQQRQLARLLAKNQRGPLKEAEQRALLALRETADRVMLQRSYAYVLLKSRGHSVPSLADLKK